MTRSAVISNPDASTNCGTIQTFFAYLRVIHGCTQGAVQSYAGRGPINSKGRSPEAGRTVIEELLNERGTPLQLPQ